MNDVKLSYKYIVPVRVVTEKNCENSACLLKETLRQAAVGNCEHCIIKDGGFVLLDFGRELHGGLNITVNHAESGEKLHLTFGESVSEALSSVGEKGATNDHAMRDYEAELPFSCSNFETSCTGFRFVKISAVGGKVKLAGAQAKAVYRDLEYLGSFECNDAELNEIWKTGAYTVQLNMQEYIWDGIKRDRIVWIGDMHPEVSTILSAFGGVKAVKDSLELVKSNTPIGKWANGIPSYSMWWIIIQRDWYEATGDRDYLEKNREYISALLENIAQHINEDGAESFSDKYGKMATFVDWSSFTTENEKTGFRAVLLHALSAGADICDYLDNAELKAKLIAAAENARKFCPEYSANKQITALASLAGMIDKTTAAEIIKKDGAKGFSTFMGYYSLLALASAGETVAALDIIKRYWGGMLKMGATSFWEEFDVDDMENSFGIDELPVPGKRDVHGDFGKFCYVGLRKSLCHGWASGPTAFLSKKVLGIIPLEPGYKRIKVCPNLGSLEWAKGGVPTPYGVIMVEHRRVNGEIVTKLNLPDGIEEG